MDEADSTDRAARHAWAGHVLDLIAGLPARQAAALRLSYFHGLPSSEVARLMDMTVIEMTKTLSIGLQGLGRLIQA